MFCEIFKNSVIRQKVYFSPKYLVLTQNIQNNSFGDQVILYS